MKLSNILFYLSVCELCWSCVTCNVDLSRPLGCSIHDHEVFLCSFHMSLVGCVIYSKHIAGVFGREGDRGSKGHNQTYNIKTSKKLDDKLYTTCNMQFWNNVEITTLTHSNTTSSGASAKLNIDMLNSNIDNFS